MNKVITSISILILLTSILQSCKKKEYPLLHYTFGMSQQAFMDTTLSLVKQREIPNNSSYNIYCETNRNNIECVLNPQFQGGELDHIFLELGKYKYSEDSLKAERLVNKDDVDCLVKYFTEKYGKPVPIYFGGDMLDWYSPKALIVLEVGYDTLNGYRKNASIGYWPPRERPKLDNIGAQ